MILNLLSTTPLPQILFLENSSLIFSPLPPPEGGGLDGCMHGLMVGMTGVVSTPPPTNRPLTRYQNSPPYPVLHYSPNYPSTLILRKFRSFSLESRRGLLGKEGHLEFVLSIMMFFVIKYIGHWFLILTATRRWRGAEKRR